MTMTGIHAAQRRTPILNRIIEILEGVPGVVNIYMYRPALDVFESTLDETAREIVGDPTSRINCWFVRPMAHTGNAFTEPIAGGRHPTTTSQGFRLYSFQIEGYLSINEDLASSEQEFYDLIDDVLNQFMRERTLLDSVEAVTGLMAETVDYESIGGNACHHVVFVLQAYVRYFNAQFR